jgi:hypothetical protein
MRLTTFLGISEEDKVWACLSALLSLVINPGVQQNLLVFQDQYGNLLIFENSLTGFGKKLTKEHQQAVDIFFFINVT